MEKATNLYSEIIQLAESLEPALIARRRDFHKYAEAGWCEMRTSSLIARRLSQLGYEVLTGPQVCKKDSRMGVPSQEVLDREYARALDQGADEEFVRHTRDGMTGVIGILHLGDGPVVAMRFDIDALGVQERKDDGHRPAKEGFASVNPGVMHACGHDAHAAIGLGVAEVLAGIKDHLCGTIKLIFQPAEEGVRGAKSIVDQGHLEDVQYLLAAHVADSREIPDKAHMIPGYDGGLATTKYDVIFRGKAAHAGICPEEGKNAILAAAATVLNLYAIPRNGQGTSQINVGTIHGGSGRNVVAETAKLELEVRGETAAINNYMETYALQVIEGTAKMHGVDCEIKVMGSAVPLSSSRSLAKRIDRVCREELHLKTAPPESFSGGGSEDVSYLMNRVQELGGEASYMRFLTPTAGPAHNNSFDLDEHALVTGVKVFCSVASDILHR